MIYLKDALGVLQQCIAPTPLFENKHEVSSRLPAAEPLLLYHVIKTQISLKDYPEIHQS